VLPRINDEIDFFKMVISTSKTVAAAFGTVANCLRVTGHDKRPVLPQLLLAITASKWLAKGSVFENHKRAVELLTRPRAIGSRLFRPCEDLLLDPALFCRYR
jgi:hypothetical protein